MDYNVEHCKPFESKNNIWMKLEHVGRYLFAFDFLKDKKVKFVADIACGDGYGSDILSQGAKKVISVDRNFAYFNKQYLLNKKISFLNLDLNKDEDYKKLPKLDAVVSFETLEHLKYPEQFISNVYNLLNTNGWFILSFPNKLFERFDENGENKDKYHLHIFDKENVENFLTSVGFKIYDILGQGQCNELCSLNSMLVKKKILKQKNIDCCFNYDKTSIKTLSQLLSYPNNINIDKSYSYIYILKKQ